MNNPFKIKSEEWMIGEWVANKDWQGERNRWWQTKRQRGRKTKKTQRQKDKKVGGKQRLAEEEVHVN